jgi:predicted NUDIX family phosphoesterase
MVSKDDMSIMVVPRTNLLFKGDFEGFVSHTDCDYESLILEHHLHMRRGNAEEDSTHKQPIPYCLIVNPGTQQVYAYKRSEKKEEAHEDRLHGKWSFGVGGHVEEIDSQGENPIYVSMLRELDEEVEFVESSYKNVRVLGYVNSEKDPVSQVHFGILYVVETDAEEIKPLDLESQHGELMSFAQLKEILDSPECIVEEWSKIAFEAVEKLLSPE